MSKYPAATCTKYRNKIWKRITRAPTKPLPPHSTYPAIASSCVATLHRRSDARYSTLMPIATVQKKAATIKPGVVSAAPLCKNATHGARESLHPWNPSMYMDIGAMFLLQNPFGSG